MLKLVSPPDMKKIVIGLVVLAALLLGAFYLFVPQQLSISLVTAVRANHHATYRALVNEKDWHRWWPGTLQENKFELNQVNYREGRQQYTSQEILQQFPGEPALQSQITLAAVDIDSTQIGWEVQVDRSLNPIRHWKNYRLALRLQKNMDQILSVFGTFVEKKTNLYGMEIAETKVKDTILMATKGMSEGWPTVSFTYSLIQRVRQYIAQKGAKETNLPMMHVLDLGNNRYETMVGIPVDTLLRENKTIYLKRMVKGNILTGEVTGGPAKIEAALKQMAQYIRDYQKTPPAIPFQLLVTDRLKQPDSTQWVTQLYYPVY